MSCAPDGCIWVMSYPPVGSLPHTHCRNPRDIFRKIIAQDDDDVDCTSDGRLADASEMADHIRAIF